MRSPNKFMMTGRIFLTLACLILFVHCDPESLELTLGAENFSSQPILVDFDQADWDDEDDAFRRQVNKTGPNVPTQCGTYIGSYGGNGKGIRYEKFLGIPYAQPPVGSSRFQRPVPVDCMQDKVYSAIAYGSPCMQSKEKARKTSKMEPSEDCLYLNIYRPPGTDRWGIKPVLVYAHESYFLYGSAAQPELNGGILAALGDIIVVTCNYRLGALGWLYAGSDAIEGNLGYYDVVECASWVRRNIKHFGGDPDMLTIGGHGAGAHIASRFLFDTELSKDFYFQGLMLMSGYFNLLSYYDPPMISLMKSNMVLKSIECSDGDRNNPMTSSGNGTMNNTVGSPINTIITNPIYNSMNNLMNTQANNQLNSIMNTQPNTQPNNQMNGIMNNQMNAQPNMPVNNQMDNMMNHQPNMPMNNQMDNMMNPQINNPMNNHPMNNPANGHMNTAWNIALNNAMNNIMNNPIRGRMDSTIDGTNKWNNIIESTVIDDMKKSIFSAMKSTDGSKDKTQPFSQNEITCVQNIDARALAEASDMIAFYDGNGICSIPQLISRYDQASVDDQLQRGMFRKDKYIFLGNVDTEFKNALFGSNGKTKEKAAKLIVEKIIPIIRDERSENVAKILEYYIGSIAEGDSYGLTNRTSSAFNDVCYTCLSSEFARYLSIFCNKVFAYQYSYVASCDQDDPNRIYGPFHLDDVLFGFGVPFRAWNRYSDYDREVSKAVIDAWSDFVARRKPHWPPHDKKSRHIGLIRGDDKSNTFISSPYTDVCRRLSA